MRSRHRLEAVGVRTLAAAAGALPWAAALDLGEWLGGRVHALGVRRAVAEDNLAHAFPERDAAWRAAVLREHYRELGRVAMEYPRHAELAAMHGDAVVAEVHGLEHLAAALEAGRGAVAVTAHFSAFELAGAWTARRFPLDFVYQPLSNPAVEAWIGRRRAAAGVGLLPVSTGVRGMMQALRANRVVAMLADQDARGRGTFVPFLGRPASTHAGPAALALRTGAPLIFSVAYRRPDRRFAIVYEPPLVVAEPGAPGSVERLTALHAARLEAWVRERPAMWFWLHRRWKTQPPGPSGAAGR